MAITNPGRGGNGAASGAAVTLPFVDFSYAALEGDIVFLIGGFASTTSGNIGPDTAGYTLVAQYDGHLSNKTCFGIWYKVMGSTPDKSVQGKGSGNSNDAAVYLFYAIRGANNASPFDNTSTTAGPTTSTNPNPAAITTQSAGSLVIIAAGNGVADGSPGMPSGYGGTNNSQTENNPFSCAVASKTIASPATEYPGAFTTWSSGTWYTITMAIKLPISGPANLKSYNTNLKANIKTINGNPIANVKSLNTNV